MRIVDEDDLELLLELAEAYLQPPYGRFMDDIGADILLARVIERLRAEEDEG